jgi:hypothetical protein
VLRIKHLLFVHGLTLAGARRKLSEESPKADDAPVSDADVAALIDHETRRHLKTVRQGLQWILGLLAGNGAEASDFVLTPAVATAAPAPRSAKKATPPAPAARPKQAAKPAAKKPIKKK